MLIIQMLLCVFFSNKSMKRLSEKLVLINSILSTKLTFERFTLTKRSDKSSPRNPQIVWRRKKARLWRWNSDMKKSEREKIIKYHKYRTRVLEIVFQRKNPHTAHIFIENNLQGWLRAREICWFYFWQKFKSLKKLQFSMKSFECSKSS